jgi:iron complex outermembrane recepter protein
MTQGLNSAERSDRKLKLYRLPHASIIASLLVGLSFGSPALAQDAADAVDSETASEESENAQAIVVTGSNIRRSGYNERAPVQVFGEDSSELNVATTINEFVGNLPANTGSMLSNVGTKNPNLIGASNFNLRNLGAGSTLVLINGRRAGKSPLADPLGNQFYDLNTLPTAVVSRVDIQTDGASAIYGSEAVAGVVNIVTKLGFEGVELNARTDFGISDSHGFDLAVGAKNDRGAFAIYGSYFKSQKTFNTDFGFLVDRLIDRNGDGLVDTTANGAAVNSRFLSTSGAPDEYRNFATGVPTGTAVIDPDCAGAGGYVVAPNCLYDFAEQSGPIAGERRYSGFAEFRYELGEDLLGSDSISLFGEMGITQNKANRAAGPLTAPAGPTGGKYTIPANHPFNYFVASGTSIRWAPGCFDTIAGNEGGTCVPVAVTTRDQLRPLGQSVSGRNAPADSTFTNESQRYLLGLNAEYGNWNIGAWAQRHSHQSVRSVPGNFVRSRLQAALNDGTLNPFGSAEATPNAVSLRNPSVTAGNDYAELEAYGALTTLVTKRKATQKSYDLLISNGELFALPGGSAGIAIGFQRREETFRFDPDPNTDGAAPDPTIIGNTAVNSVFAEVVLPIVEGLEVQAAIRYEDHGSVVGKTVDPKFAVRYDATPWLAFRGSYGTSFQAPSSNQQGGIVNSGSVNYRTVGGVATCGGADLSSFIVAQIGRPVGTLKPQSAKNLNLGVVVQSGGFDASLDYWRYNYSNLIVNTQNAQAVLDSTCAGVANGLPPRQSDLVTRTPNGQPTEITLALQNADKAVTDGVDIALSYRAETGIGKLGARVAMTYVNRFAFTTGVVTSELAGNRNFLSGSFGSLPRWRGNLTGTFENGDHEAFAVVRYTNAYKNDDPVGLVTVPRIKKFITVDAQYSYSLERLIKQDAQLTFGVKDIFDSNPPDVGDNRPGFDEQVHSPRGRVFYVGAGLKF